MDSNLTSVDKVVKGKRFTLVALNHGFRENVGVAEKACLNKSKKNAM